MPLPNPTNPKILGLESVRSLKKMFKALRKNFYTAAKGKQYQLEDGSRLFLQQKPIVNELPPRVHTYSPKAKLSPTQIAEIKEKRTNDPDTFTVLQLAKEYNTFPGMIMRIAQCPSERKAKLEAQALKEFESLSLSKKKRAIDRIRRKALW